MARMRTLSVFVLSLSLLAVCVPLLAQDPCTITVQWGESIQAAIDAAPEGSVICLGEGQWVEPLRITKSLTVRGAGAGKTILRANPRDRGVVLIGRPDTNVFSSELLAALGAPSPQVVLDGVSILGTELFGVMVNSRATATLFNCTITQGNLAAVAAWESAKLWMEGCTISGSMVGIEVGYAADAVLANTSIKGNSMGVHSFLSGRIQITASSITRNMIGAELSGSSEVTLTDSAVSENMMWGVFVQEEARALFERTAVTTNGPMFGGGIMASMAAMIVVSDCTVSENGIGIQLVGSAQATLQNNHITANQQFGVCLGVAPCVPTESQTFQGFVTGSGNVILGPELADQSDAFCPDVLSFLVTPEGGALDLRE